VCLVNACCNEYIDAVISGLQVEIKQNKSFNSLEEEVLLSLFRTADQLQWRVAEMLEKHGLSPTQYNALRIVRGAGPSGLRCSEIGERMITHDPDITRLLNRLERRSLVRRGRERNDRRVIKARITTHGLRLLASMDEDVNRFTRALLGQLGEGRLRSLLKLLEAARVAGENAC
jgi:DNA-binding MarR family transcriptional regulator